MNINRLKPMGFRNSGKFGFAGRDFALIAALVIVVVLALLVAGRQMCKSRGNPLEAPKGFFVKCTNCDEEWEIKRDKLANYQNEDIRGAEGFPLGGDCPKCKSKGTAFIMIRCPNPDCGKYYLSKRITDPKEFAAGKVRDVCPKCGTDLKEWHKERQKRR